MTGILAASAVDSFTGTVFNDVAPQAGLYREFGAAISALWVVVFSLGMV
ncbi:hypothetical protein SAMN05421693_10946 [Ectothiorhodospira magna]|uniref:Uncharacterized protein n=1 Tax=Ectothiorhodospira magna TaxID=867345 RepID=A0A1H9BJ81_9GAMM|nr:hypothetical protein SAMN05421693_10946 [Ectothiorhodospira magna]